MFIFCGKIVNPRVLQVLKLFSMPLNTLKQFCFRLCLKYYFSHNAWGSIPTLIRLTCQVKKTQELYEEQQFFSLLNCQISVCAHAHTHTHTHTHTHAHTQGIVDKSISTHLNWPTFVATIKECLFSWRYM